MKNETESRVMKPFLHWVGGKKQIMGAINQCRPRTFERYYEPFVGGGVVFMSLQHPKTTINDFNPELINVYKTIRDNVDELVAELKAHDKNNSKEYYLSVRAWDRTGVLEQKGDVERAARFIYLNRTCFNGLFRVNAKGQFNSPYGYRKQPHIVNEDVLRANSLFLGQPTVKILNGDFADSVKDAQKGDFVYLDPPYAPLVEGKDSFVRYTFKGFDCDEQLRARDLFVELDKKGCYVMLSNSNSEIIRQLYKDYAKTTEIVKVSRRINPKATSKVDEVLVMNYDYRVF